MWMPQHAKHPLFRFGCIVDDADPERIAVLAWMEAQRAQRVEHRRRRAAERTARNVRLCSDEELERLKRLHAAGAAAVERMHHEMARLRRPSDPKQAQQEPQLATEEDIKHLEELAKFWDNPEVKRLLAARAQVAALELRMVLED